MRRSRYGLVVGVVAACGVRVTNPGVEQQMQGDAGTDASAAVDAAIDAPPAPPPCNGSNQAQTGSACFTFNATPLPFGSAAAACQAISEHLAIVRDGSDNAAISTLIGTSITFLGGTEQVTPGTWLWPDGTQFWNGKVGGSPVNGQFFDWGSGEPNDGGGAFLEECLTIRGDLKDVWDDRPCGPEAGAGGTGQDAVAYAYVCERP